MFTENYIHHPNLHDTQSAKEILPKLFEVTPFQSVLDIGCGTGSWLKVVQDLGIIDYLGVDGLVCDISQLHIHSSKIKVQDLNLSFDLQRKFDLVISLEVAEHLHPDSSEKFIANLVRHSDLILFSAAIPNQGGQNHLNEQWTNSYWIDIFQKYNYKSTDLLRHKIWCNDKIHWWYRQNIILFFNENSRYSDLPIIEFKNYIHPDLYMHKVNDFLYQESSLKRKYESGELLSIKMIITILLKKVKQKLNYFLFAK